MFKKIVPLLLLTALLAGCVSTNSGNEEVILTQEENENALKHVKTPQQANYGVYNLQGSLAIKAEPRLHPNHMVELLYQAKDAPVVKAEGKSSRNKLNVLIDPASAESWMEFNKAEELNAYFLELDGVYIPYRNSITTGVDAFAATISQLRFNQFIMDDIAVFVRMARNSLGTASRGIKDPQVHAVLGYDMLKGFEYIQFNIREGKITLSATTPYTPSAGRLIGTANIINRTFNTGLIIKGAIEGTETPIMLDFVGSYYFRRSEGSAPETEQVALGDKVVYLDAPTITGTFTDQMPRAGNLMLEKYLITVCPRKGIVYFERPNL